MSRVFLSHSSRNSREAVALKQWLVGVEPGLAEEIFLDLDPDTGIRPGLRWKEALRRASTRCEAVICLLSRDWAASPECMTEYRHAEDLGKPIFCARLEQAEAHDTTREWQRCDLFGGGPKTTIDIRDGASVVFLTDGLNRLRSGLRAAGIAAESFPWPPPGETYRAPYRGWRPLESVDAAVYFGRDAQIVRALDSSAGCRPAVLRG